MIAFAPLLAVGGPPSAYWYLTRATGAMALVLLTVVVALGVADVKRFSNPRWPRFVIDGIHRYLSLLAVVFIVLHVLTSILDGFAPISVVSAVIPFTSPYRPLWLGLGAVSLDLMIALILTSLMRTRISNRAWRVTHWSAWACWPIALLHGFGSGSDARNTWFLLIAVACIAVVALAAILRSLSAWQTNMRTSAGAMAATGAFLLFLAIWLPIGPLARNWASRAGTPPSLLGHSSSSGQLSFGALVRTKADRTQ